MPIEFNESLVNLGGIPGEKLVGNVGCRLIDKNGNVVFEDKNHNNILLNIRYSIMDMLAGARHNDISKFKFIKYLKLGSGTTPVTIADTGLANIIEGSTVATDTPVMNDPVKDSQGNTLGYLSATFSFVYPSQDDNVDNKNICEMGLYDSNDNIVARTVVGTWTKSPGLYFEVYWTIGYKRQDTI